MLANNEYDVSVKDALTGGGTVTTTTGIPITSITAPTTTSVTTSTMAGTGSCTGVAQWQSDVAVSHPLGVRDVCFR